MANEQAVPKMGPNERVRYVPDNRSFGAFMKSAQMRDATARVANDIAALARATSPSASPSAETHRGLHERVRAGYKVEPTAGYMNVGGNLRVRVKVVNTADGSALIEFGTRGLFKSRTLARAGARFGDFKPTQGAPGVPS